MKLEHWMQLLVGVVILGSIAFLSNHLFEMKGTLSSVETKVDEYGSRVNRIAETLPEVKARVAWEEVNHAITGFIAVSKPIEGIGSKWVTTAALYDRDSEELSTYSIALDQNHKDFTSYMIAGKLKAEAPYESSFTELVMHSQSLKEPVMIPAELNPNTSFVIRSLDTKELGTYLRTISTDKASTRQIGRIKNWKELSTRLDEIVKKAELLKPPAEG